VALDLREREQEVTLGKERGVGLVVCVRERETEKGVGFNWARVLIGWRVLRVRVFSRPVRNNPTVSCIS